MYSMSHLLLQLFTALLCKSNTSINILKCECNSSIAHATSQDLYSRTLCTITQFFSQLPFKISNTLLIIPCTQNICNPPSPIETPPMYRTNHPEPGLYRFNNPCLIMYDASEKYMYERYAHPKIRKRKKVITNEAWENASIAGRMDDR